MRNCMPIYSPFAPIVSIAELPFFFSESARLMHMLGWARERHPAIPVSLEVEKPRDGIDTLFGLADVLMFSADYARHHGYAAPTALLQEISRQAPRADLFCSWGDEGAVARDRARNVSLEQSFTVREQTTFEDAYQVYLLFPSALQRDDATLLGSTSLKQEWSLLNAHPKLDLTVRFQRDDSE